MRERIADFARFFPGRGQPFRRASLSSIGGLRVVIAVESLKDLSPSKGAFAVASAVSERTASTFPFASAVSERTAGIPQSRAVGGLGGLRIGSGGEFRLRFAVARAGCRRLGSLHHRGIGTQPNQIQPIVQGREFDAKIREFRLNPTE